MSLTIATYGLTKRFGRVSALEAVELRVAAGEVYAFIGRNGAGKTTMIRLLLGMLRPTAGHAAVLGAPARALSPEHRRRVGYLVEGATAYPELTVQENLQLSAWLYSLPDRKAVHASLERFGLGALANRRAATLSTGNLQRLALARALLHEPELVILDEPATALDPAGVVEVRQLIRALAYEQGTTVFMSSHILSEVERVATRIGIVHEGRLVAELSSAEFDRLRRPRLEIVVRDCDLGEALLRAAGLEPVRMSDARGGWQLHLRGEAALASPDDVARLLVNGGAPPLHLAVRRDELEQVFLALTESTG
ncbi:MAG TPA: ABC transporter ATP-binding protein [Longimicrobiales bacterium]|nr:ABC transporter ATP-binding protein [Longimicrobiales bacterium]